MGETSKKKQGTWLNWCNLTEKGLLGKEVQDRAFGGDGPETTSHKWEKMLMKKQPRGYKELQHSDSLQICDERFAQVSFEVRRG